MYTVAQIGRKIQPNAFKELDYGELYRRYLKLTAQPRYSKYVPFQRRRKSILEQDHVKVSGGNHFVPMEMLDSLDRLRKGNHTDFSDFHRVSSLAVTMKYLLHSEKAVESVENDPILSGLLYLSGLLQIGSADRWIYVLLDHLVLLKELKGITVPSLAGNLLREATLRGRLFWQFEKINAVLDSFVRLSDENPDVVKPLVLALVEKVKLMSYGKLGELERNRCFLLAFYLTRLDSSEVPVKFSHVLEKKVKRNFWKLNESELSLPLAFWVAHGYSLKDAETKRKLKAFAERTPGRDPFLYDLVQKTL